MPHPCAPQIVASTAPGRGRGASVIGTGWCRVADADREGERLAVTFAVSNYAPSVGGAQEYFRQVAEGLVRRGHDIEVLTTDAVRAPSGSDPGRIEPALEVLGGVHVRRFHQPRWGTSAVRARRWWSARVSRRDPAHRVLATTTVGPIAPALALATWRAGRDRDVVVGGPAPFTTATLPGRFRSRRGARVAVVPFLHVHRSQPHRAVRRALQRADLVVAMTTFEQEVLRGLDVDPQRQALLSPGTHLDAFAAMTPTEARRRMGLPERPTVGFVGRLASYKGVDTLLDAAPHLWAEHPELTVLLAGATTGWAGHREPTVASLAGDRLVVLEDFSHGDRAAILAACDVVVCPSREESFGMVIIEAWAARRPVVAADIDAVRSTVERCSGGSLVPVDDALALAAAVGGLLKDPARAREAGEAGRRLVEAEYTWPAIVDGWEVHLRALATP